MALEMSHQTPAIPPNTLTESSDDQASYVYQIKLRFVDSPDIYDTFLRVLKDYRCQAINNVDAVNRISGLFAGHPDLLQGFKTYMTRGSRIECGTSNETNTICATGHPVATNSITPNKHSMYSNPPSESHAGTPEFVKGVYQLSLANAGSSVETILHDQTDALVSVPATRANVQGAPASVYDIRTDGALKYMNDAKKELNEEQHKEFTQLILDSMNKNADISDINQRKSILFTGYPELEKVFDLFFNLPTPPPTPAPTQQNTGVVLNPLGAAQHLYQQSEPIDTPTTILAVVQPPALTRPGVSMYPSPVVRVLNATMDLKTVSAFAKLYRVDGTDVTKLLEGNMSGIYSNGDFRFPDLKIGGKGRHKIKISLWHLDNFVGSVDTEEINVGDRLLLNNPIMNAQEIQYAKRQLYWQDIDDNVKDDPEGCEGDEVYEDNGNNTRVRFHTREV
ncbi:hypothetical protein VE00_10563 [Pseudogymnoascus sp. WSF 3629]|nr:hypothetical protein VE00_10563 [Pseudogymnoascus sp. WSF 3629]